MITNSHSKRLQILVITPSLPIPTSGARTRIYNLIKNLAQSSDISVLSFVRPIEYAELPILKEICANIDLIPIDDYQPAGKWRNRLNGWANLLLTSRPPYIRTYPIDELILPLRKLISSIAFDVVILHLLFVAPLKDELADLPAVLAEDNVESNIARRVYVSSGNRVHQFRNWMIWRQLLAFERRVVRSFKVCVAVSGRDAASLQVMSPATEVHIVSNGVDVEWFASPGLDRSTRKILFFGTLNYRPNADGLVWFCREVFPRIQHLLPDIELDIIGLDPPPVISNLKGQAGVNLIGFTQDIREKLWSSSASVVPLHAGGGTRLKILEALAAECPVVSTTIGAEGLGVTGGDQLLIADTSEAFASSIVELLEKPNIGRDIAERGRQFVSEYHDWRMITPKLEEACRRAIALNAEKGKQ